MKKLFLLVSFAALFFAIPSFAASSMISRGGFGFLFPDHNSLVNPGQTALDHGTAIDFEYTTQSETGGNDQSATPSIAYGSGTFGFGVDMTRSGTSLTASGENTDTIGAGMGVALAHQKVTVGVDYSRQIDGTVTDQGTVGGTLTYNSQGDKRMGFTAGVGATTVLSSTTGTDTQTGLAAIGWGFNNMTKFEVDVKFNDLSDFSDYDIGGYLTLQGNVLYAAAGFNYLALSQESELEGRVGVVFGKLDINAFVDDVLNSGNGIEIGGALRIAF